MSRTPGRLYPMGATYQPDEHPLPLAFHALREGPHREHAAEMREAGHSDDAHADPASVSVEPGATGTSAATIRRAIALSWAAARVSASEPV